MYDYVYMLINDNNHTLYLCVYDYIHTFAPSNKK